MGPLRRARRRPAARSLHVAVPESVARYDDRTGTGKMWRRVLAELTELGVVVRPTDPSSRTRRRRPDVWLIDGHAGPPEVEGPIVAQLHEAPWLEDPSEHGLTDEFRRVLMARGQASARRATLVITGAEHARRQIAAAHGIPESAIRVVPLGVDSGLFRPDRAGAGLTLLGAHGVTEPFVLYVSSVHPRKNLPALREAMAILADRGLGAKLVMILSPAADRPDSAELLAAASAPLPGHPDRVVALSGLAEEQIAGVMAAAAVLCAPSRSEGFGLVPLEAMASGTPVVVSNRGSLPEVPAGAGLVVEPEPTDLAGAIETLLTQPDRRRSLQDAGLRRARDLSWRATARGWMAVLEEAASRSS